MFRVLIVDDEPIHRRGFTNMIKRLRPEYEIADAKNGLEALDYIKCNQVDLVITDIQMPIMNGLQLIEELRGKTNEIKIIILSVYGYFDYAQKAIALGAFDYLLKPVDEAKVEQVLTKVEKKILQESEERNKTQKLKQELDKVLQDVIENKMNKLIYGVLDTNEHNEIRQIIPSENCGIVIVFELDKADLSGASVINEEIRNDIKYRINRELNSLVTITAVSFLLQDETNSIVSIVDTQHHSNLEFVEGNQILNKLICDVKEKYGFLLTIGVGTKYEKIFMDAKSSFKHAKRALKCKYFVGNSKVIFYNQVNIKHDYQSIDSDKKKELVDAILKFDKDKTSQVLDGIISAMLKDGYPKVEEFINCMTKLLENNISIIDEKLNTAYVKILKPDINEKLNECNDFEALKAAMNQTLFKLIDMLGEQKNNINNTIIETCKKFIKEHYMEDISLESVAQEFYFNPSYFSNFFKCNTNTNFSEYLNKTRMNEAKRLLQDNDFKIYEISKMVGYQDPKYFSRLFKKESGLTPDEYRRISGMNKLESKNSI